VRWRAPVRYGFSSPVIAKGQVYVTDALLDRPKVHGRILCFEEATGKLLWTFSREKANYPEWAFVRGQEPSPNGTPAVQDGKIYATGPQAHNLYCLEAASGKPVWERDLAQDYQIEETATISASPLVDGDLVILQVGGKPDACVVAFNRKSGKEIWRSLNETAGHASPMIVKAGGRRQLIVWTTQSVSSLDPATGQLFWRELFSAGSSGAVATPVFSGNQLLVSGLMLKLDDKKPSASVLWPESRVATRRILSGTSTPLLQAGYVYSLNPAGNLVCLEADTGRQIWETDQVTREKKGSSACMHMTVNGRSVFIYNEVGELIMAHLSPEGYEEICRTTLLEPTYAFGGKKLTWAAPSFANGHVYARNEKEIICASLRE
jgi:outer membrane protein assembly factor BamB